MQMPRDTGILSVFTRTYCLPRERNKAATADGGELPRPAQQTTPADGGGVTSFAPREVQEVQSEVTGDDEGHPPFVLLFD
eukprot:4819156-Alexandrium_andersonii.AAC.1